MLRVPTWTTDLGLLVLRLTIGPMMLFAHGLPKLLDFSAKADTFADPLGVGATTSLVLAIFGELVCAALITLGVATRAAAVPLLVTMLVAALIVHGDDPWARKEFALLYAVPALVLVFTGPGRFSIDHLLVRGRAPRAPTSGSASAAAAE